MKKRLITTFMLLFLAAPASEAFANDAGAPVAALDASVATDATVPAPEAPVASGEVTTDEPAKEADTAGADVATAPAVEAPDIGVMKSLYDAAVGGDWRTFVILLLIFTVGFVRWGATKWERLDRLLNGDGDWSGAMLVFGLSMLGAFATAWQADAAFNYGLFQAAWENAVLAFGGYSVVWKKLVKPKLGFVGADS